MIRSVACCIRAGCLAVLPFAAGCNVPRHYTPYGTVVVGDRGWVNHVGEFSDRACLRRGVGRVVQRVVWQDAMTEPT